MDGEEGETSTDVPPGDPIPDIATPMEEDKSSQDRADTSTHSKPDGAEETPNATPDQASEKPSGTDVASPGISEGATSKESSGGDGSSVAVATTTPNVVVEKVGGGLMTWNLTAAGGDGDGEGKETGNIFPLDLGGASTILTQDQILKIDAALKSEQIKAEPNPLLEIPHQDTIESIEAPDDHHQEEADDHPEEAEEKMQLNIDSVLDIGPGSFNTKLLMNQVMSSEILMEAIGDDGLVAAATVVKTTSGDESDSGSTTDSTSDKKREDNLKRRSARIAHITANDLTLRQAIREKEQKKKEREEKKRQKEEEKKVRDSSNVTVVEGGSDTPTTSEQVTTKEDEKEGTDLSSEIAKYLKVIDQEIKQTESQGNPDQKETDPVMNEDPEENKEISAAKKEEVKDKEDVKVERKERSSNLFDILGKGKEKKEIKEENVKEEESTGTAGEKEKKVLEGTAKKTLDDAKSKNADIKEDERKGKTSDGEEDMELGEVKEEKETGELSDEDDAHQDPNSSVYWMDHSYAASPKGKTTSSAPTEPPEDSPTKRTTRRESRKAKSAEENSEEKTEDEKLRRSSRRESKVSKEEETKEAKPDKKSKSKHDRKDKKSSKEKKDKDGRRSRSKDKDSSKEDKHRRESRSKSVDNKNKDKKKKKRKEKDTEKEKDESKKKKSSRSSREIKKPKYGDDELSDIPFSSEEEEDHDEKDDGEHSGGSDWTSDDDPEKLWCICRQPHDGKFMICCDKCEDWFHGKCVNITKKEGKRMEQENQSWMCPKCTDDEKKGAADKAKEEKSKKTEDVKDGRSKEKERRKSRDRKKAEEEDDDEDDFIDDEEEEEGKRKKKGKGTDEKRRKRKSDAGIRKDSESKKQPEEEVASKKKRLKFFRPPPPKQHCIGTRCENWARLGSVYCSPACIVKHAKESMNLLSAEKERAAGLKARRDSTGSMPSSSTKLLKLREDERISVIERHTGRLRTGLTAPTYEELPYWLGRHPTYEVLRPNIKHGYTTTTAYSGKGSSKHKSDSSRRLSHEGDPNRNISSSDSERKISTKQITSPNKDSGTIGADNLERRQRERREKVRQLLEMKRREEEAIERELERKRMEENRRRREEEKREEEERKKKEEEKKRKEDRERREREKREKEERLKQQAESSRLAEQTSESVRVNVKRTLLDVLLTRVKKAPDVKNITSDDVKKVSKQIEFELYKLFNDTGAKYKAKYRTLIFNIKDMKNKGLFRHILKGEISPRNLVRMSSDQLASQELMKWREQEAKHELDMIVQTEKDKKSMHVTIVKKTHKGEVELGEEDNLGELVPHTKADDEALKQSSRSPSISEELKSPSRLSFGSPTYGGSSPTTPTSPTTPKIMLIDTTEQHKAHLFDLNCKICTGKIPAPKEEKVSKKKTIVRKKVIKKVIVEKKKGGILKEKPVKFFGEEIEEKKPRPKSVTEDLYDDLMETVGGVEDDDDDDDDAALIFGKPVDEARTPPGSPPPPVVPTPKPVKEKKKPSQVKRSSSSTVMTSSPTWRGFIFMHEVSKFVAVAHHVSGPAQSIPMDLQDTLEVCGRIPYKVVWDYFTKLKQSQSTEMTVMRFHVWQDDEEAAYFALFDYFYTRQRIGVIGKNRPHVKDFYLIALPSSDKVPHHILPFNGPGLPSNRPHMLLGIVVRHKDKQRSMSLDDEPASKPISQPPREPPVHHAPKRKHHQPAEDIKPPENPMSSFRSGLPNLLEMSDMITPKDVPMKTKDMYVTEDQLVDPIVAQYANADPKELEAELEEPYSPTREERNAPYDPSDPTDDWIQGRSMPASAVIPEPALPQAPSIVTPEVKEVVNPLIKTEGEATSDVKATDIASVAADASQDLLSAFSEQSGLSEQQQLLIQLTKQVEEAKKALLDRQIESLQSEINKATGKIGKNDKQSSDEAGTSPDVRLAQADSSTMTPKDDSTSTPVAQGGDTLQEASVEEQPLCPPPNLPPFAVGAVLWNATNLETIEHKQSPTINQPQLPVTHAREGVVGNAGSSVPQAWKQDFQPPPNHPPPLMSEQLPPPHLPLPKDLPRHSNPTYSHTKPHSSQPTPLPHSSSHVHEPPHHHRPSPPPHHPPPSSHHPSPPPHGQPPPPFQSPPIPRQPSIPHRPPFPRQPLRPHQPPRPHHPPIPHQPLHHHPPPVPRQPLVLHHPAPEPAAPSVPVTKKRKLEPPPPGEEGWKYGDDEDGPSEMREESGPMGQRRQSAPDRQPRRDVDYRRNVNIQKGDDPFENIEERRRWEDDKPRESWAREHWDRERRGEMEWGPKGDRGRGGVYEDWSSRDYPNREDSLQVDYQHKSKEQLLKDPRMGRESPISRDYGHRAPPR